MKMPVMGVEENTQHIAARWPDATVIATSGYDLQEADRHFGVRPAGFLQKPYTAAQLTAKIAEVVRARAS
jgi:CheY-like chemotaxis protein